MRTACHEIVGLGDTEGRGRNGWFEADSATVASSETCHGPKAVISFRSKRAGKCDPVVMTFRNRRELEAVRNAIDDVLEGW
jgi:hypothetical protein